MSEKYCRVIIPKEHLMHFLVVIVVAISASKASAFCSTYKKNNTCFDFSLRIQREIAYEKRRQIQDLSGSTFAKRSWEIRFPELKKCRDCNLQEVHVRPMSQSFVNVDFTNSNMKGFEADNVNFEGSIFVGADLRGAKLFGSIFRQADLRGANLEGADLSLADFRGANLSGANLKDAVTFGALFSAPSDQHKKVEQ